MRSDMETYYNEEIARRHRGEKKEHTVKPYTMDHCIECDRYARLCSSCKCVHCHAPTVRKRSAIY